MYIPGPCSTNNVNYFNTQIFLQFKGLLSQSRPMLSDDVAKNGVHAKPNRETGF